MKRHTLALSLTTALAAAAIAFTPANAQHRDVPDDLTELPPVSTEYDPPKHSWGEYDFTGTWPIENIPSTRILFQRMPGYGERQWVTKEEHDKRVASAERSDAGFAAASENGIGTSGTEGLVDWTKNSLMAWRTSMLVEPKDGQLPALTPEGQALYDAGRSGWVPGIDFDWVSDFDSWDRCVSRGFPASMYPFRYNNGIKVFQSPGYIVIVLEMLGTRVIPIGEDVEPIPSDVEGWLGFSRAHWEGKTLVIETTNIKSGDSATHDVSKRNGSPLNMATQHVPPFNTIPTSTKAKTVERLTMTGPNTLVHELTYSDPDVFTAPWTTRLEWSRNEDYQFFEYACHEGNYMPRDYISASRAHRAALAAGEADPNEVDSRLTFARQFDFDPVAPGAPQPFGFGPPPPADEEEEGEE
jgi:hypothetical protein